LQEDRSVDIDLAADARAVPLFERGATAPMLVADLEPNMVDGLEMTRDHVAARPPDLMREAIRLMREALSLMREALSLMREAISLMREAISLMREAISLMREAISLMREAISLMREAISLMREAIRPCSTCRALDTTREGARRFRTGWRCRARRRS
jgi:hypothetical protein